MIIILKDIHYVPVLDNFLVPGVPTTVSPTNKVLVLIALTFFDIWMLLVLMIVLNIPIIITSVM